MPQNTSSSTQTLITRKKLTLIVSLVGLVTPLFFIATRLILGGLLNIANNNEFSGIPGFALGLALTSLVLPATLLFSFMLAAYLLKRKRYQHVFLVAATSIPTAYYLMLILSTAFPAIDTYVPIIIGLFYPITFNIFHSVFNVWRINLWVKVVAALLILAVSYIGFFAYYGFNYKHNSRMGKIDRGFDIYETTIEDISTEYLGQRETTVRFAESEIDTSFGKIHVIQTEEDETVEDFLDIPANCNHDALYKHVGVGEKLEGIEKVSDLPCEVVYEAEGRVVVRPRDYTLSDIPYIAKIGNTVIIFHAYTSTAGDFGWTKKWERDVTIKQAESFIIDFIREVRVISNGELGLL